MNKREASKAWHVPEKEVRKICRHMKVDVNSIPDDLQPVYIPNIKVRRDTHNYYFYVLNVIANPVFRLEGVDADTLHNVLVQLREIGLIVPKKSADPQSADYRDYILSADRQKYYEWTTIRLTEDMNTV